MHGPVGEWIRFVTGLIVIPLLAFTLVNVLKNKESLAVIQSNRWTSQDQAVFAEKVWHAIELKANRSDVPPPHVIDRFERLEDDIKEIRESQHRTEDWVRQIYNGGNVE